MIPTVELLEDRCVLNASLDLGTIGPRIDYGPAADIQPGDAIPLVTMPPPGGSAWSSPPLQGEGPWDYWSISAAFGQADVWAGEWPTYAGPGEWAVFNARYTADFPMAYAFASIQRFTLPHAESVGIGLHGGTVTVYQVAFGSLWSTSTTDEGLNWSAWQQVAALTVPQQAEPLPPNLSPFGWLADMDAYEPGPDLDGDGMPDGPGTENAAVVYGAIVSDGGVLAVGWMQEGRRFATVLGGETYEVLDGLFADGAWLNEADLWGM